MNNRWRGKKKLNKYVFSQKQIWSAYKTMEEFNLALLKEYRKTQGISYPIGINSPEEWIKLIDRFIWVFDQIVRNYPDSPHQVFNTCHINHNGCKKEFMSIEDYNKYILETLHLFAEYFQGIWD